MAKQAIPYWHVDAFASEAFRGNQAAIMILDEWLPDATLQAIGAENQFAETAFMVRDTSGQSDWELRWFTPAVEVAMCGHATLASGHVALMEGGADRVTFSTREAGILEVRRDGVGYALSLPITLVERRENPNLLQALRVDGEVFESVSGAEETAIVLLENEAAVRGLKPDFRLLKDIPRMAICTAPGETTDIVSRVFVSAYGIDEDSVTGSAHAALAPFWSERLGRNNFTAHQASTRGGDLTLRLAGDRARLGGPCVTVVEGTFYLTG